MKTALQHFNELPAPYGQMAIDETIRQGFECDLKKKFPRKADAVYDSFLWFNSELGFSFWHGIIDNLQHLESKTTDK